MSATNANNYSLFQEKREEWLWRLHSEENPNSIVNHVFTMVLESAFIRALDAAMKSAPKNDRGEPMVNPLLQKFILSAYATTQLMAIRRLTECRERPTNSLPHLLKDMKQHHQLFTRENILRAEGLPVDCEQELEADGESIARHKTIDQLCGVDKAERDPGDKIRKKVFVLLTRKLGPCKRVISYVDGVLAHLYLNKGPNDKEMQIAWKQIRDARQTICKVFCWTTLSLFGKHGRDSLISLWSQEPDQYLDRPLIDNENLSRFNIALDKYSKEVEGWCEVDLEEFLQL